MIIKCYNEKHPYLLFIDLEFDQDKLIEFSGLLFKWIDDETYQLDRDYTAYVNNAVCYPFAEYTAITNNFLNENGVPLEDVAGGVFDLLLKDIPLEDLLIISHGLKNDRLVLLQNGINLTKDANSKLIDGYCTFNNAKRILGRNRKLKLSDIANECAYHLHNAHNAFNDVWAEVAVFTYLKKKEKEKEL